MNTIKTYIQFESSGLRDALGGWRWTSSRRVDVFHLGLAVKPSNLRGDKFQALEALSKLLKKHGYSALVIDSETADQDIKLSDYARLVHRCVEYSLCTPVLTIPVRRHDFHCRLEEFMSVLDSTDGCGVCLVAGNRAYLDEDERRIAAGPLVLKACEMVRRIRRCLLMVGTERMEKTASKAACMYGASPFILLNPALSEELGRYDTAVGVYAPFYIGNEIAEEALDRMKAYVTRRAASTSLEEAVNHFCLMGGLDEVSQRVSLACNGVNLLVGYPLALEERQIALFAMLSRA
ncbi:MAG: hypothetical protein QXI02_02785 [Candidatus Caldarchaeum sp.]